MRGKGAPHGRPGVNLVGYVAGEFGVGAAARLVGRMVRAAGLPLATTGLTARDHRHAADVPRSVAGAPFDLSVFAVNAEQLREVVAAPDFAAHLGRTRVGVWYWEVGALAPHMRGVDRHLHEVWCTTDHVHDLLEPWVDRPVVKHPLVLEPSTGEVHLTRADLGLPEDRFLFGFVFDHQSVLARKNPHGLIDAYTRAFGPDEGTALVLKSINAHLRPAEAAVVAESVVDRPDVIVIDRHASGVEMRALYHHVDAYVSLHRSEGLGLTMASAMLAGTPAIATGFSGNLEFMDDANSFLVPFDLVEVGPGCEPYPADAVWAEPDLDAAAALMRKLAADPDEARRHGANAREAVARDHSAARAAAWMAARYDELTRSPA